MKRRKRQNLLFALLFLALQLGLQQQTIANEKSRSDKFEQKGLILLEDFPGTFDAIVEVNLTQKLISLVTKSVSNSPEIAELIQMLEGIYVRTYNRTAIDEQVLVNYFQQKLKENSWEVLVKIKQNDEIVEINLLFDEDTVYGIFAIVIPEDSQEVTFVNIVGKIAPERIGELLDSLSKFGVMDIDVGGKLKAQAAQIRGTIQREMSAVKIEKAPVIDGVLNDVCWKITPQADRFTQAPNETPVDDDTQVKLAYTDEAIYVGWYLRDSKPDKITAHQTQNHVKFKSTEDWVAFSVDPFHTHRAANRTVFMANPLGKKYVHSTSRDANKTAWREQWKVAANIITDGWVVEMEIPWKMLDYPNTAEPIQMGINFERAQARTNQHSWWSNIGVQKAYKNDGHWLNVLPPPKLSRAQGLLDTLETGTKQGIQQALGHENHVAPTSDSIFRAVNTSSLSRVDGLRLGVGFEMGKQGYPDPLFFSGSGSTIRQGDSMDTTEDEIDTDAQYRSTPSPFLFGSMGYALSSRSLNYQAGGGITSSENLNLTYRAQIHRLTTVRDRDILLSEGEQFYRALWGTDFQDYYLREGAVMSLHWHPQNIKHSLGLSVLWEEHKSLQNRMHFHLFNWSATPELSTRANAPIDNGSMHSISLKYDFDNRRKTQPHYDYDPGNRADTPEWYNTFLIEHATAAISSDFDFTRFQIHLRNYHPIGDDRVDTRLKIEIATDPLPFQRQFVIGGIGTLRGYSLYEFVGNHGFLFNLEYMHSLGNHTFIVPFIDIGQVWEHLEDIKHIPPKVNLGIGFQLGPFRLNLASPIEEERRYQLDFKVSRMF